MNGTEDNDDWIQILRASLETSLRPADTPGEDNQEESDAASGSGTPDDS